MCIVVFVRLYFKEYINVVTTMMFITSPIVIQLFNCSYFAINVYEKSRGQNAKVFRNVSLLGKHIKYFICLYVVCIFSGGTLVTVSGSNLDSVAVPLVSLTVVITNWTNNCCTASLVRILEEVVIL